MIHLELPKTKRILYFSPHPDDEILAAGAFLSMLKNQGNDVTIAYLTLGSNEKLKAVRRSEAELVCKKLGFKKIFPEDIENSQETDSEKKHGNMKFHHKKIANPEHKKGTESIVNNITNILNKFKPEIIFTVAEDDPHPTHKRINWFVEKAVKRFLFSGEIYYYSVWSPIKKPDFYYRFTEKEMKKKIEIMNLYASQLNRNKFDKAFKGLNSFDGVMSVEIGKNFNSGKTNEDPYAESFCKVDSFGKRGVLSIGDIFLDILPQPIDKRKIFSEGSTETKMELSPGGNAANFALALGNMGKESTLFSLVGDDWKSNVLERKFKKNNLHYFLEKTNKETSTTYAISFKNGNRHFQSDFEGNMEFSDSHIPKIDKKFEHLHRGGFFWLPNLIGGGNLKILKKARKLGLTTSLDVGTPILSGENSIQWNKKTRKEIADLMPYTTIFFGNEDELKGAAGIHNIEDAAFDLLTKGAEVVVIHEGSNGASVYSENLKIQESAVKIKPKNPTGAGDIFNAAFVCQFLSGKDLKRCLEFAVAAGTLHTSNTKNVYPSKEDIKQFISKNSESVGHKIKSNEGQRDIE